MDADGGDLFLSLATQVCLNDPDNATPLLVSIITEATSTWDHYKAQLLGVTNTVESLHHVETPDYMSPHHVTLMSDACYAAQGAVDTIEAALAAASSPVNTCQRQTRRSRWGASS